MAIRGIRGATTASANQPDSILSATKALLLAMVEANPGLVPDDIASSLFTTTDDLDAAYPAKAARELGWDLVPLMCAREISVPGSPERCIRVLLHWNTDLTQAEVQHIYLEGAVVLRPDLIHQ